MATDFSIMLRLLGIIKRFFLKLFKILKKKDGTLLGA